MTMLDDLGFIKTIEENDSYPPSENSSDSEVEMHHYDCSLGHRAILGTDQTLERTTLGTDHTMGREIPWLQTRLWEENYLRYRLIHTMGRETWVQTRFREENYLQTTPWAENYLRYRAQSGTGQTLGTDQALERHSLGADHTLGTEHPGKCRNSGNMLHRRQGAYSGNRSHTR
ncbi:hypothetical protein Btru_051373 [Bulinus truncatus]|nr:hypothetical protein Btru_051373 [Bulinus truncatus]